MPAQSGNFRLSLHHFRSWLDLQALPYRRRSCFPELVITILIDLTEIDVEILTQLLARITCPRCDCRYRDQRAAPPGAAWDAHRVATSYGDGTSRSSSGSSVGVIKAR
jgi:hypothetical protein